ncbi:hypothetical protein CFIMG_004415RA [Ceratocystis fimbriata CBS 114723]|uniref:Uncharacterized protein n=1 Tax=Ceratocystis fimbriata CBS 114723 TaxID=1035309 RepID=A0A2C5WI77_9PEZI|nr:hypothetical protein CFIMG_004415RA [Ceratocystis fimbriata CBS 114723]
MSGPENAPISPAPVPTTAKAPPPIVTRPLQTQAQRKSGAMSSTSQSRPTSSSSAVSAPSPLIRPISRTSTAPSTSRPFSTTATSTMGPSPPSSISFSPTSATHETSNAPRAPSSVTPSISVTDLAAATGTSSAPISRTTTPPMGSIVAIPPPPSAAVASPGANVASAAANQNALKPRSLKAILQSIIATVDEVRGRQNELDDVDEMLLEISELKGHLEASNAEFTALREHMTREVTTYKEKKDKELKTFKETKEKELQNFKTSKTNEIDTYKARKELEVRTFRTTKEQELEAYKATRTKELEDIRASKTKEIEELNQARLKDREEFAASRAQEIEDAVAAARREFTESHQHTEEEMDKLRTERDTAVFTKESLMAAFENRYAQWDIDTRNHARDQARVKQLEEELKNATDTMSKLSSSLTQLTSDHEKCASKDREFANNAKGLSSEVAALMVKSNLKAKEASEYKKQATEYKKRYEKSHSRLGMLTLDTKDIADKFRDLDNSFHDLAWNFFSRELPTPTIKLTDLPGSLWSFPQVQSNSKAAQYLRSALAEALISYKLSTCIFRQFYIPEASHVGFESMRKILEWMDQEHADQAQAIRCQLAIVSDKLPDVAYLPTATATELCNLLQPWLNPDSEAGKSFKEGLTLLMQRAMAIWQQMQRGSQLARAMVDSPEQRWLAAEDARERYSSLTLDENLQKQQAAAMALAGPEFDRPIAVLFPQIHFGNEICFSGHALFQSQACVVAARAERNATTTAAVGFMPRRRTIDASSGQRRPLTSSSNPVPSTGGGIPPGAQLEPTDSAASGVRPARPSSRQAVQSRISGFSHDVMKKLSGFCQKKSNRSSRAHSIANDSGIGTPVQDSTTDDGSLIQNGRLGRLQTRSMTLPITSTAA